jgi:hypothetical protein
MPFAGLGLAKYESLLIAQHWMRQQALGGQPRISGATTFGYLGPGLTPNPMWQVGDFARLHELSGDETMGMPKDVLAKLDPRTNMVDQMAAIRAPWFWLGWIFDQGLQRTSQFGLTKNGHYFAQVLWIDGPYPIHNAFMIARRQMVESFDPEANEGACPSHVVLDYTEFLRRNNSIRREPKDPTHKALYRAFVGNCYRMSLYLLTDSLRRSPHLEDAPDYKDQVGMIKQWFDNAEPEHAEEHEILVQHALAAIAACH